VRIPEEKIQEVREATNIVEVVSQYVTLKKRGKTFFGLCPFHTEKTPSFSVDPIRGFYHCFGCGEGGNVFSFVMQMEKVSFPEALRSLAKKAGVFLPAYEEDEGKAKEIEALYTVHTFAATYFRQCLTDTHAGKRALEYLENRGFCRDTIETFQIGYAPDAWDSLLKKAEHASIQPGLLQKAGLVVTKKEGHGYYDRFRGRLMFPVLNLSGRIVGFGGRSLKEEEGVPKYVNSPETPIYHKSRLLYGLFQSKSGVRREDRVLLVEGYTDLMRLHQNGLDYGVATSGTALTGEQAKLLSRYSKNVTLVFDGDSAGFNAAIRGVDILLAEDLNVDVVTLPRGSDPDSFLRDRGKEALEDLLNTAQGFIDFQLTQWQKKDKLKNPFDRATAARNLLNTVVKIRDPLQRNAMVKDVSEKLGVDEKLLFRQMGPIGREEIKDKNEPRKRGGSARRAAEQGLLLLLLEDGKKWGRILFQFVEPRYFQEKEIQQAVEDFYDAYLQGRLINGRMLLDKYIENPGMTRDVTGLMAEGIGKDVDRSQFGLDCLLVLRQGEIQEQIAQVQHQMRTAQSRGEDVSDLNRKWMDLKKEHEKIKREIEEAWKKNVEIS